MYDVGSGGFAPDRRDVQLTSEPALPLTLGPHEQRTIALRIIVHGCGTNKPLEEYQGLGYMNLQAQFGNAPNDDQTQPVSGVDLSAVVGAALQRSCG
jgi:hypothetical protein